MTNLPTDTLLTIGLIIAGISYAVASWRNSSGKASKDLVDTLTKELTAQKEINLSLQTQITNLTLEIGKLQGVNLANEAKLKEYTDIITNRSPELERSLANILDIGDEAKTFMTDARKALNIPKKVKA